MFVILGATGNIGGVVASTLLAQGYSVRALGRDESRLQPLIDRGAEPMIGAPEDPEFMRAAFTGAVAVFTMMPPLVTATDVRAAQGAVGSAIAAAIAANQVGHVVNLSSLGADLSEGTGPVLGLHDQERRLDAITGLNVVHLRPTYFMENLLRTVGMIQHMRILGDPLHPEVVFPMIASRDIAAFAAERLIARDFAGSEVRPLLGPADWTMPAIARVLGAAIGFPELPYVQFPYDKTVEAMIGMGMSADAAHGMVEVTRAMNEGRGIVAMPRDEHNTTPTTLERFAAEVFAPAYRGAGAAA